MEKKVFSTSEFNFQTISLASSLLTPEDTRLVAGMLPEAHPFQLLETVLYPEPEIPEAPFLGAHSPL